MKLLCSRLDRCLVSGGYCGGDGHWIQGCKKVAAGIRGDIRAEELPGGHWIRAVRKCQDGGVVWQR